MYNSYIESRNKRREYIMKNLEMQVGMIIKAKDFGHLDSDFIIGEITYVSSTGMIEGMITKRVMDNKDVTGLYDDGFFTTVQNGKTIMDRPEEPRLSEVSVFSNGATFG
jgi:hypothetical protein